MVKEFLALYYAIDDRIFLGRKIEEIDNIKKIRLNKKIIIIFYQIIVKTSKPDS